MLQITKNFLLIALTILWILFGTVQSVDECYYCSRGTSECILTSGGSCQNPSVYKSLQECTWDCVPLYQCNPDFVRGKVCQPCVANKCNYSTFLDNESCESQTSCGVSSGFQCAKRGNDYKCILCDDSGCMPGMTIFDSKEECEKISLCRSLSTELLENTNLTKWQCSKEGFCAKCGGPSGDPACLVDRPSFEFPADCISNTGCHRPAPSTRFQCVDGSSCNMCREDQGECDPELPSYPKAEDCMMISKCQIRESAYYSWQCEPGSRDNVCAPCREEDCQRGLKVYYSIEECVLHSICSPADKLPPKTVYQCRNNDICSQCRLDRNECNPDLRTYPTESSCLESTRCSFVQTEDVVESIDECLGFRDIFPPVCAKMAEDGDDYCRGRTLRKTCAKSCCISSQNKRH